MLKSKKIVDWLYNYSLYFIIGALLLVIIAIEPSFVRVSNFTTILTQSATKIIYACGIAGIIVLGGTDLALGREVGLAAVVAASLLQAVDYSQRVFSADQVPALPLIVPLLLVMVLLGIICAAHGFIVAHWGVAPFVASLGVQLISYGLCLQYFNTVCNSNPLSGFTKTYSKFCQGTIRIGNISLSYLMFYAIAVVAVMWVIWNRTTLGKNMFAIGGNREAAKVCGVNVKRTIIIVYIIAGLPYTPGHEMAGVIVAVGKGVDPARIGEHISAAIDIVCGECEFCRIGRTNLCRSLVRIGFERDGSHEEYCVIPAKNAFTVDPTIPFEEITGIPDAVGCMYNGLKNQAKLGIGQTLLILGVGGLGMNAIQIAKLMGATVYATSRKADKLEVAKQMGADAVIDTSCEDLRTRVAELTNGRGVDVVLDNIGLEWSINEGVYMVRPGGKVLVCGYISEDFKVNYQEVMKFEKEILGMRGMTRQDMAEVVELVNQRKIVPYVYKTVPFEQINEALGLLRDGKTKGRVVLLFPED